MSRRARDLTPSTTYKVVERPFWGDSSLWSDFEGQGGRNKTKGAKQRKWGENAQPLPLIE